MTTPQPAPQLFDAAHPYLGETPAQLTTDVVDGPSGQRGGLTIRIPNTTVTVLLVKDDLETWINQLAALKGRMTGLILPPKG